MPPVIAHAGIRTGGRDTLSGASSAQWTNTNQLELGGQARAKADGDRFVTQNNSIVTAQVGASVILHCKTSSATGGLVSWIRKRDYQLLTVGLHTHSSDDRFSINYVHWDWQLHIRYVQPRDAGLYECQVSSHPPTSLFVRLQVVEAEAEILGAPEKHVKLGSILRLVCIMHHTTEALSYVFWYRGNEMINYESEEGTGSVVVESDDHTSVLIVASATRLHSGNYTCAPSNTKPASILVHVLNARPSALYCHNHHSASPASLAQHTACAVCQRFSEASSPRRISRGNATWRVILPRVGAALPGVTRLPGTPAPNCCGSHGRKGAIQQSDGCWLQETIGTGRTKCCLVIAPTSYFARLQRAGDQWEGGRSETLGGDGCLAPGHLAPRLPRRGPSERRPQDLPPLPAPPTLLPPGPRLASQPASQPARPCRLVASRTPSLADVEFLTLNALKETDSGLRGYDNIGEVTSSCPVFSKPLQSPLPAGLWGGQTAGSAESEMEEDENTEERGSKKGPTMPFRDAPPCVMYRQREPPIT
ncbi:hypothetical protein O3P69_009441 [Scylla paramamosain]|uniref:Ig-like domain-containing protein n=1 Tax=Scylla paramamosain TaxID=85552 RepID=A0AAW0STI7_SCYPA